jgi:hypothetical protein
VPKAAPSQDPINRQAQLPGADHPRMPGSGAGAGHAGRRRTTFSATAHCPGRGGPASSRAVAHRPWPLPDSSRNPAFDSRPARTAGRSYTGSPSAVFGTRERTGNPSRCPVAAQAARSNPLTRQARGADPRYASSETAPELTLSSQARPLMLSLSGGACQNKAACASPACLPPRSTGWLGSLSFMPHLGGKNRRIGSEVGVNRALIRLRALASSGAAWRQYCRFRRTGPGSRWRAAAVRTAL